MLGENAGDIQPELQADIPGQLDDEDDDEPEGITPELIGKVLVSPSDWTTETILAQLTKGNIDINPSFQRRDAWTVARKSKLVESLLLGLPIPQIVLAEKVDPRGQFLVLDGKQRLLTLLQFTGKAEGRNNAFKLSDMDVRKDLVGKTFTDLEETSQNDINVFYNQTLRTVVVRNWRVPAVLHMLFRRLNTGSVPLSPQELRQALFPGPFLSYLEATSMASDVQQVLLGTTEPDFRMRDVELLVRYFAFSYRLASYAGNLSSWLDDTCKELNVMWDTAEEEIKSRLSEFNVGVRFTGQLFGPGNVARKWTPDGAYEKRLNRAILDTMLFYFSRNPIREAAEGHENAIVGAFKDLCLENDEFRTSIETTTKSLVATHTRLSIWGQQLANILDIDPGVPEWDAAQRRIVLG